MDESVQHKFCLESVDNGRSGGCVNDESSMQKILESNKNEASSLNWKTSQRCAFELIL